MRLTFIIAILFIGTLAFGQENKIEKITISEDNNPVLNDNYSLLKIPDSINTPEYRDLRNYVMAVFTPKSTDDPEIFFELMNWVSNQWKHNGWNAAPDSLTSLGILKSVKDEGQQYRCVEYGVVLNDVLLSYGYVARQVRLKHIDADYGGAGMGHVATEVWSNILEKWIFLDPQFGVYASYNNKALNIYDIYQLKSKGLFNEIKFIQVGKKKEDKDYGKFLTKYLGYIDVSQHRNDRKYRLALKLEGERNFVTFQAFPTGNHIFTNRVEDMYYNMNQTMVIIDYSKDEYKRSRSEYAKLDIKSAEKFNENMHLFAAQPNLTLTLDNNTPWFSHYIVKLNGQVIPPVDSDYSVSLKKGENIIEAVAINKAGIKGVITKIHFTYD